MAFNIANHHILIGTGDIKYISSRYMLLPWVITLPLSLLLLKSLLLGYLGVIAALLIEDAVKVTIMQKRWSTGIWKKQVWS